MNIRIAKKADLETLINLGEQLYLVENKFEPLLLFSREQSELKYSKEFANPNALFLLAEENNKSVGYLYAHNNRVNYFNIDKLECEIEAVFVEPDFQGKGIARLLVEYCIEWAKTKNVFRIKTGIYAQNETSQSVFSKLEFTPYHTTYILQKERKH